MQYRIGLFVPLGVGLGGVRKMGPWYPWVSRLSGLLLLILGVLLLTGTFTLLSSMLMQLTPDFLMERL